MDGWGVLLLVMSITGGRAVHYMYIYVCAAEAVVA